MAQDHDDQDEAKKPQEEDAAAGGEKSSPGGFREAAAGAWSAIKKIGIGAGIAALIAFAWLSGLVDAVLPSTEGIIRIESPQIYTRERLVNDRFRERAWLEKKLVELDDNRDVISSVVRTSTAFATGSPASAGESKAIDPPAVQAQEEFGYLRNARATIRRALIENELDDRHDLGSNSLYQFDFGAAIITGTRTRRVAAIKMTIEPENRLRPLNEVVGADSENDDPRGRCQELREFECAFLFEAGILRNPTGDETEYLTEFQKWRALFERWIDEENALFKREADDVEALFTRAESNAQIESRLRPFFRNLNKKAETFAENLARASGRRTDAIRINCRIRDHDEDIFTASFGDGNAEDATKDGRDSYDPIGDTLDRFVADCIDSTNAFIKEDIDYDQMASYLKDNNINNIYAIITNKTVQRIGGTDDLRCLIIGDCGKSAIKTPGIFGSGSQTGSIFFSSEQKEEMLDGVLRFIFGLFNDQCSWSENAVDPVTENGRQNLKLTHTVKTDLMRCIINSAVRDYGSHPFRTISRQTGSGGPGLVLNTPRQRQSSYLSRTGLSSILYTDQTHEFRSLARLQYIGVVARDGTPATIALSYEPYPYGRDRLEQTCSRAGVTFEPLEDDAKGGQFGVSTGYSLDKVGPHVDPDFGWAFLEYLLCQAYKGGEDARKVANNPVTDFRINIPIGLFRFISLLSDSQRTFSYSVQPSGSFDLGRLESDTSFQASGLWPGGGDADKASTSRRSTASTIEKDYRIIGFGTQVDFAQQAPETGDGNSGADRHAEFGWYVLPSPQRQRLVDRDTIEPANVNLTAVVSLPAWWDSVKISAETEWLYPGTLESDKKKTSKHEFRVELPLRLEFIRNHFLGADSLRPTLYQLYVPSNRLTACQGASIVIKGERLWRSTVVTLGGQKASLIQVMPDMRGIIAEFEQVAPPTTLDDRPTLTIWTSEGQTALPSSIAIEVPPEVRTRMSRGEKPCAGSSN